MSNDRIIEHPAIRELREQLAEIELDVMTSYTLGDAIREGSTVTTQEVGGYVHADTACALGAGFLSATARGYVKR